MSPMQTRPGSAWDPECVVSFLEAAYALDLDDPAWLSGLLKVYRALSGTDGFAAGFFYDASDVKQFTSWGFAADGASVKQAFGPLWEAGPRHTPEFYARTYRRLCVGGMFEAYDPDLHALACELGAAYGVGDFMNVNGINPDGSGCLLAVPVATRLVLTARERQLLTALAGHLASAYRYRRRLRRAPAGDAEQTGARKDILAGARWTLVDAFERDGSRYIVARENEARASDLATLSRRERQVVGLARLGRTNKEIAHALGVAHSTVRVLLVRAARKLGVASRSELL
jgi:DNA-binding CsgD family transcriptional regulator